METNNILEELLLKEFTTDEQHHFVKNFKLYLQYGLDNKAFVISADDICEWLEFTQKTHLKRLIKKHFVIDADYSVEILLSTNGEQHGGHNKERIMTTTSTFKAICMLRDSDKGRKTRMYYAKMEEIFFNYMNIKHQNTINTLMKNSDVKLEIERHNHLKKAYKDRPCVYIARRVAEDNNIVKLGESDDIHDRIATLSYENGEMRLIDVYPCICPHDFEQFLLHHNLIAPRRIPPKTEFIQLDDSFTLDNIRDIINKNIMYFNQQKDKQTINVAQLRHNETISKERLFVMQQLSSCEDEEMKTIWKQQLQILNESCKSIPQTNEYQDTNIQIEITPLNDLKRKVYKYSLEDLSNPIAEFTSLKEAARSVNNQKIHDYHIREACLHNTAFAGFRWYFVDNKEAKPDTIPNTSDNVAKPVKRLGLLAKLNTESDKILNIYHSQKNAAADVKVKPCTITFSLTNNTTCAGFRWKLYEDCDDDLKATFEGDVPEYQQPDTCNKSVKMIDPLTKEVVENFSSLQDACSKFATCHKTIKKYSATGDIYKGYIWKISG
jgi:phage anti-repressor protein